MTTFLQALAIQRWDDHRYYHHSRINQSLHLLSALCFLCCYALLFTQPVAAAMAGWLIAMASRQIGHFFFEPRDYDVANQATHEYKEAIKVGYNLHRKRILMGLWALSPVVLTIDPTLVGMFEPHTSLEQFLDHLARVWIALGAGALLFRTLQLCITKDVQTGLVWFTKILTDPFHDVVLYHRAPLHLLRGELVEGKGLGHPGDRSNSGRGA